MKVPKLSTGTGLFLGIVTAAVLVPTAAVAASTLVTITGPSGAKAAVNPANQLLAAESNPANNVVAFGLTPQDCATIYTVPAGKALILKSAQFQLERNGTEPPTVRAWVYAGTCGVSAKLLAASNVDRQSETVSTDFGTGVPIPSGQSVIVNSYNNRGSAFVYGYLVPSAAVPASALDRLPNIPPGKLGAPTLR